MARRMAAVMHPVAAMGRVVIAGILWVWVSVA
jgi:hypothetical protein